MFRLSQSIMRGSVRAFSSQSGRTARTARFSPLNNKSMLLSLAGLTVTGLYLNNSVVLLDGETKPTEPKTESKEPKVETPAESNDDSEESTAPQSAYNPETGEINWNCPCLGGMAQGPCGDEFKEAFSCFVYSEAEPKGIDCVEKFKNMQNCFRKYPEIYSEEIRDDETPVDNLEPIDEPVKVETVEVVEIKEVITDSPELTEEK